MRTKLLKHLPDGGVNKLDDIMDGQIGSDVRRSIAEEYLDGRVNLHVHVRFVAEEYCTIFNRNVDVPNLGEFSTCPNHTHFRSEDSSGEQKVSVLIRIAKFVEIPEPPPIVQVPRTVARLKRIYDGNYCVGHPLELTPLVTIVFVDVDKDWELIAERGRIPLRHNQLPNKMVKGTSEVVQHFPDTQAEVIGHRWHIGEAVDLMSRCVIDVFGDSIGIEITEGQQICAQSLTLLCGPVKFSLRTFKGGHNDTLQKDSENTQGARDTRAHKERISRQSKEGCQEQRWPLQE